MKNISIKSCLVLITILLFITACEKDLIKFNSSMDLVGFSTSSISIREDGTGGVAKIYLGAPTGSAATVVTLTVDTVGLGSSAAKEGVDFTLPTKSVNVSVGESEVEIIPINNSEFTGDKKFYLVISGNSLNYKISAQKRFLVTISDDEHPLKAWIGTYTVSAVSYGNPGSWDEIWTVMTAPVEGDVTKLTLTGIGSPSANPIFAVLDKDAMTITVAKGQNIGDVYAWGDVKVYYGFADLTLDKDIDLTGTLENDGTIKINNWGQLVTDPVADWVWDVFNTTWNKQK
jgi:hypothetical protein